MAGKNIRLSTDFVPSHYALTLEPDLKRFAFSGSEHIHFILKKPTKKITLHALELSIHTAAATIKNVDTAATVTYNRKTETATLLFSKTLPRGRGVLALSFSGILNDKMLGFYRSTHTVHGVQETMAVTQFESTFARYAFPCVDEPAVKATFDVTLTVEAGLTTISNTIETRTEKLQDGRVRVSYERTPIMSTYLLAFLVGKFGYVEKKSKHGTRVRVFAPRGKEHQAGFALEVAVGCLDFYEVYFGIRYPLPVLDHIAIPDFSSGAMENWGAITYRESALLYDAAESSSQNKQRIALVIAHELAHQWFGNLVTMEWWTDLWLNEGFANYIEYLAIDHLFPEWDIWTQFVLVDANEAMRLDALTTTHAIEIEVHHPSEINEIFDTVSYAKGATVIRMLATYVGAQTFRKGLHTYLKKYAYKNAKTRDLWTVLEKVSGKPVRRVMEGWTRQPGYPLIHVTREGARIGVSQKRYYSSSKRNSNETWVVPMGVAIKNKVTNTTLDRRSKTIRVPERTAWVLLNSGSVGMFRTHYDTASLLALAGAVRAGALTSAERVRLVSDVFTLAFSDDASITDALTFVTVLSDETDYSVWGALIYELDTLRMLVEGTRAEQPYREYVHALLTPIAKRLDWTPKPREGHTTALLRGAIFSTLAFFEHGDTIKECIRRFKTHEKGSRLSPDLRPAAYGAYVASGGTAAVRTVCKHYEHEEMHAEKNKLLVALGRTRGSTDLRRMLAYALGDQVRFQDSRLIFLSAARTVRGAEIILDSFEKHWDTIVDRYGKGGHDLPRYVGCLSALATNVAHGRVKKFFKSHPAPGAERAIAQTLESIKANAMWRENNIPLLTVWLSEWQRSLPR